MSDQTVSYVLSDYVLNFDLSDCGSIYLLWPLMGSIGLNTLSLTEPQHKICIACAAATKGGLGSFPIEPLGGLVVVWKEDKLTT